MGVHCVMCTLHRAEGLYGSVRCRGYMRDSLVKLNQVDTIHVSLTLLVLSDLSRCTL